MQHENAALNASIADTPANTGGVRLSTLAGLLLALFAADNILLLQFLGLSPLLTALLVAALAPLVAIATAKMIPGTIRVPWRALGVAGLVALTLFVLGGEGRFFYSNADWQVRDAILADMAHNPWPFAYTMDGEAKFLRAPIGLYLLPSLAGTNAREIALLLSDTLRLGVLIAMTWPLFATRSQRLIALAIFVLFSGADVLGTILFDHLGSHVSWDHIEHWNLGLQYSSHVTQAFWVPNHALAGWTCAVTYLLWRRGFARIGLFAAMVPLAAIWSPLAIMGAVPFALHAGLTVLRSGDWKVRDVAIAALALTIAIPALLYMQIDAEKVGGGLTKLRTLAYPFVLLFEVLPFALPPILSRMTPATDKPTLWIILGCLLAMPWLQIGTGADFQMRASIMPLALLALMFAQWVNRQIEQKPARKMALIYAAVIIAIGAVTPAMEIRRALVNPPSSEPFCSLVGVWNKQAGLIITPPDSYLADAKTLPGFIGKVPIRAGLNDPAQCWDHRWVSPMAKI